MHKKNGRTERHDQSKKGTPDCTAAIIVGTLNEALQADCGYAAAQIIADGLVAALERHTREVGELRAAIHYGIGCGR